MSHVPLNAHMYAVAMSWLWEVTLFPGCCSHNKEPMTIHVATFTVGGGNKTHGRRSGR